MRQHHLATASYPLDQETLALTFQQADPALAALPVPDLTAYRLLSPVSLPGLTKGVGVPGWSILRSWFALTNADRTAARDLARDLQAGLLQDQLPPLRFLIETRRSFIDAFFSNLMPLIVVAFMLFVILLTTTGETPVMERMKTGTNLALSMCSALFFVVVFAHIGVRQRISGDQIFYLEYFYFLMYVLLLCVSLSAILFVMNPKNRFFQHRHNLISKLLYWPTSSAPSRRHRGST